MQIELFVALPDERVEKYLLPSMETYTFFNDYSGLSDFVANMSCVDDILENHRLVLHYFNGVVAWGDASERRGHLARGFLID